MNVFLAQHQNLITAGIHYIVKDRREKPAGNTRFGKCSIETGFEQKIIKLTAAKNVQ